MDQNQISEDFASFADPATRIHIRESNIFWTQNRSERTALLVDTGGDTPDIVHNGRTLSYEAFFASEGMADLRGLAETMRQVLAESRENPGERFVDPPLTLDDQRRTGAASELFPQLIAGEPVEAGRTKLVFLKGRAGDGKSAFLVKTAHDRASAYLRGEVSEVCLYVNAQGSALAKIDEVFAKVTQDFRAKFTYNAIATLTRLGLILPVIDGFDELLGVSGYKDAFSSLATFVSRLHGRGVVVASARSTFYQFTTFGEQALKFSSDDTPLSFKIVPATLEPWRDQEVERYLRLCNSTTTVGMLRNALGQTSDEVLSSPFLTSQVVQYGLFENNDLSKGYVVKNVVDALVTREQGKLLDPNNRPLLSVEQHNKFLRMMAEEMWWLETRELDYTTLATLSELFAEETKLSSDVASRFIGRMPTHVLFTRYEAPARIGFRHEFYFAYYLASGIATQLLKPEDVVRLFSRSLLTTVMSTQVSDALDVLGTSTRDVLGVLGSVKAVGPKDEALRINVGAVVWGLLARYGANLSGEVVQRAVFSGLDFGGLTIQGVALRDCVFAQCSFVDTTWANVTFENTLLVQTVVSGNTRFDGSRMSIKGQVIGLLLRCEGRNDRSVYDYAEMVELLSRMGAVIVDKERPRLKLSERASRFVESLHDFLRIPERTVYFSEDDFFVMGKRLDSDFRDVFALLYKHGLLIRTTKKHRSGTRAMYRLTDTPYHIKEGQVDVLSSGEVRAFWEDVRRM